MDIKKDNTPGPKARDIKPKHLSPQNKDNLDSRKKEEQDFKGDDITHNRKPTKEKRTGTQTGLTVRSIAFSHGGHIPKRYSCEGDNINPPLEAEGIPAETRALAIIVEDHDAPDGIFDHWLVWNIPPHEPIAENNVPGINGRNSFGKTRYDGPCPPSGTHRYFFKLYALDAELNLAEGSDKKTLQKAMRDHVLASGELMAHYSKSGE